MKAERVYLKTWIQVARIKMMREISTQIEANGLDRSLLNVINHITTENAGMFVVRPEDQVVIDIARARFPDMGWTSPVDSFEE